MSIKIHHGAPGSYKTSGALSDDLIPNLLKGRCIVTNVRGLTRERVMQNLPDCPESLEIINIDTSLQENRDKFKLWFSWVPLGAFIIIDEAQMVFPKSWTKSVVDKFEIEGTEEEGHENYGRPHNFTTAFEMHRHYNWDLIFTTPNIKLIRDDIRLCADGAFYHRDMGAIGINGRYKESYHSATDPATLSNFISVTTKKVNKNVFKLYGSTTTGDHSYTTAGIKIWKDPRLFLAVGVLALSLYYASVGWINNDILNKSNVKSIKHNNDNIEESRMVLHENIDKNINIYTDTVNDKSNSEIVDVIEHPYQDHDLFIKAALKSDKKLVILFHAIKDKRAFPVKATDLYLDGYTIIYKSPCHIKIIYNEMDKHIFCHGSFLADKNNNNNKVTGSPREFASKGDQSQSTLTKHHSSILNKDKLN